MMQLSDPRSEVVHCPTCRKWWKPGRTLCAVMHYGGCCHHGDTEVSAPQATPDAPESAYRGMIIIECPPAGPSPYCAMPGRHMTIWDAATGKQITTCSEITIHASVRDQVTADLTLFTDADGEPLLEGQPTMEDGEILTGVFPFYVAEMRVRADHPVHA